MAWIANVTDKNVDNGVLSVTVVYTNDDPLENRLPVTEYYKTAKAEGDWLSAIIRDRIETLKIIPDIPIGTIEPAPPVPPMDVKFNQFSHILETMQLIKTLIDLKIITEDHKTVLDLKAWIVSNFDAEIVKMIGTL